MVRHRKKSTGVFGIAPAVQIPLKREHLKEWAECKNLDERMNPGQQSWNQHLLSEKSHVLAGKQRRGI